MVLKRAYLLVIYFYFILLHQFEVLNIFLIVLLNDVELGEKCSWMDTSQMNISEKYAFPLTHSILLKDTLCVGVNDLRYHVYQIHGLVFRYRNLLYKNVQLLV